MPGHKTDRETHSMNPFSRRKFLQFSAASLILNEAEGHAANPSRPAEFTEHDGTARFRAAEFTWEWSKESDEFRLVDRFGLTIANGKMQPVVVVEPAGQKGVRHAQSGKPASLQIRGNAIAIDYDGVNGNSRLTLSWRFDDDGFWLEPIVYESAAPEDVVSFHFFAEGTGEAVRPALGSNFLVHPGASESGELSPILLADEQPLRTLNLTNWIGHGSFPGPGWFQQWGLPAHYICGFHRSPYDYQKTPTTDFAGATEDQLLNAFCCGLAELPSGQLFVDTAGGRYSLVVSYRGDLWGHLRGPGRLTLGPRLYWTVGPNYYEAIRNYYRGLLKSGVIKKKVNSPRKNAMMLAPSFDTWGAQVGLDPSLDLWGQIPDRFDEKTLNTIYNGLKASGMKVKMFVIDGYWEGKYGNLRHSVERFPHFEATLERIRKDGYYLGLWAAFMRCEDPTELGLTTDHMMRQPDGKPFVIRADPTGKGNPFYLFDFTQPEVQRVMASLAKQFVRRYQPDFVKFDFGYEIPPLSVAAPKDMRLAGERMLLKGIQVIGDAMREVNPDIVVLYYSLSPLFIDYFDLHSPDDLGLSSPDYDLEANRRFFFSSLLGEIGMPTWGSGGYDWLTSPDIWFDTAPLGALGSLGGFAGPDPEALATPERVAKFNGLAQVTRPSHFFSAIPLDAHYHGPIRGGHASSWARVENGEVVVVALRKYRLTGGEGSKRFRDLVATDTSVVLASRTDEGLARTKKLAVVPCGDGQVTLKRDDATGTAEVTEHYFRGGSLTRRIPVVEGKLRLPLRERTEAGALIEWIEVNVR
jgi:hypothetical protein